MLLKSLGSRTPGSGLASVVGLGLPLAEGARSWPARSRWFEVSDRVFLRVCVGLTVSQLPA